MNRLAVSVPEAARLLSISERHAWNLVKAGRIPTVQLGRRKLVAMEFLRAMMNGKANDDGN